jgi:hypothetical protein
MRDSRNVTAVCDDVEELAPEQVLAARRTVAANSKDAAEARETMLMLGIHPESEQGPTTSLLSGAATPRSFS